MRAVPFVFLLFPVYGLDGVGEVITYDKKERITFPLFLQKFRSCV